jgi:putative ABC transport system permease protein
MLTRIQHVAIVSESFASRYFPAGDPLGREIRINDNNTGPRPLTVVGVIRDLRHISIDGGPPLDIYIPLAQVHPDGLGFVTGSQFWTLRAFRHEFGVGHVRRAVGRVDRNVAVARIRPMTAYVDDVLAPRRASVATLLSFAAVAFILAAVGVYSVIAYTVEQRRRELGVRMALGASRQNVARHVMGPAIVMSMLGILVGAAGALATRQLVASLLFGVTATDPVVMILVATLVLVTGTLAAAIPALRATRIDPAIALNSE